LLEKQSRKTGVALILPTHGKKMHGCKVLF